MFSALTSRRGFAARLAAIIPGLAASSAVAGAVPASPMPQAGSGVKKLDYEGKPAGTGFITPLVLHGGSGVSAELLRKAIACSIRKINFGTELKNAFTIAVKTSLSSSDDIDLRRTFAPAISAVEEISRSKIQICSSVAYERQTSTS